MKKFLIYEFLNSPGFELFKIVYLIIALILFVVSPGTLPSEFNFNTFYLGVVFVFGYLFFKLWDIIYNR